MLAVLHRPSETGSSSDASAGSGYVSTGQRTDSGRSSMGQDAGRGSGGGGGRGGFDGGRGGGGGGGRGGDSGRGGGRGGGGRGAGSRSMPAIQALKELAAIFAGKALKGKHEKVSTLHMILADCASFPEQLHTAVVGSTTGSGMRP